MSSLPSRTFRWGRSLLAARVAMITGILLVAAASETLAQQRIIVNPTFVQRLGRGGEALPDYNASVPKSFCTEPGSCFRYLGDARCLTPTHTPVDSQGCMAGWITTDPYDDDALDPFVQDGHIKAPTQVGIGPNVEGLNVPDGSAELNAHHPGRLYQIVCLAGGEVIPFRYSLGDPTSTGTRDSQARFGIFENNTSYPGNAAGSVVTSSVVSTQTMVPQVGSVTAPAIPGLYQIGFEAVQPDSGTQGNYISDVSITLKPLVDFAAPAVQILEGQSGFLLVRVNGTVPEGGISVSLQPGASTASPSESTFGAPAAFGSSVVGNASLSPNGAGGFLLFIPQGAYDGNALSDSRGETATNPSGSVRIPILTTGDTILEDNETFSWTVQAPGTNGSSPQAQWDLATAASCSPSPALTTTAVIVDNDVDLVATKLADNAAPAVGGGVAYTVTFTNPTARPTVAPETAHDVTAAVSDAVPPGLTFTSWTCAAADGASCPGGAATASGSGAVTGEVFLPAGGKVTFTIDALVDAAWCGSVINTATIAVPAPFEEATSAAPGFSTQTPEGPGDNSASATIVPACPPALLTLEAASTTVDAIAGQSVTLGFRVTSSGSGAADGARIDNPIPSGLSSFAWTCTASGGAVCPNASGSGPISETVGTFPSGGSLIYAITALVAASAPSTITNTVTVTPPAGGLCSGSCTVTTQVLLAIASIPSLSTVGLLTLAVGLAAAATWLLRR
ncbi:MAG TPA: DUF11 domain-containing protein [Thermoanaerobaculia bacterium]|nr:DUF11 domain-containing protein [Thermoanaerobaculia bacterium]